MLTNGNKTSIGTRLRNLIRSERLPPEKNASSMSSIFDFDHVASSISSEEVDIDDLEVFNKYKSQRDHLDLAWDTDGSKMKDTTIESATMLLDINFDTGSELSFNGEYVPMELTPFEETPLQTSLREAIKNKFKKILSNSALPDNTECHEGQNFSPISLKMPVIEDSEYYTKLDLLLFNQDSADPKIRFNQFVDVLVYNGNFGNNMDSGNSIETNTSNGLWRMLSLRRSITSAKVPQITSILKNKTNSNYEYEALQLQKFDKINFENFMANFENYESCKIDQEPHLNDARVSQLRNYYQYNK